MPTLPEAFRCLVVSETGERRFETRPLQDLPPGEVLVRVAYSSLNYKDAMAASGNRGVVKKFPHVPGIDAAGVVAYSSSADWQVGDRVIVTGYELGSGRWGGFAEFIRVPADWVVRLPTGLSLRESMILGTAGFTAAQCVQALVRHRIAVDAGEIVVTGATGGVGSLAVSILARLGYQVAAVSGKAEAQQFLTGLGARQVIGRNEVRDASTKPLLPARWAGAVDTVGGETLATLLRSTSHRGCVTACGLVGGADLPLTVYPFILRGVTLAGIDSAMCPMPDRLEIWSHLASDWKPTTLDRIATEIELGELNSWIERILAGKVSGRVLVRVHGPPET